MMKHQRDRPSAWPSRRRSCMAARAPSRPTEGLAAKGLDLRADSSLCNLYINGDRTVWSLDTTVARMVTMHVLDDHTRYPEMQESAHDRARAAWGPDMGFDRDDRYDRYGANGDSWTEWWRDAKERLESLALQKLKRVEAARVDGIDQAAVSRCGRKLLRPLLS